MQRWSADQFQTLTRGATVLAADEHGDKVLLTPDERIVKLFRRKRLLSSALIRPYAARFARASRQLARLAIPAVIVEQMARVPSIRRDLVVYRRLDGMPLREALVNRLDPQRLLSMLAALLARLHARGVYFRAVHFGNVLVRDGEGEDDLALIDVSEARFRWRALSPSMRARNFRHLTSYAEDLAALQAFGLERFLRLYEHEAAFTPRQQMAFRKAIDRVHPALAVLARAESTPGGLARDRSEQAAVGS